MFITELILRLRDRATVFQNRVGGMASFEKATTDDAGHAVPYAFVVPVEEIAAPSEGNSSAHMMTQTYLLVVALDNAQRKEDGRGYSATSVLTTIRRQFLEALLGWEPISWSVPTPTVPDGYEDLMPNSRADTLQYRGFSLMKSTDARIWYQFEFSVSFYDGRLTVPELDRHRVTVTLADHQLVVVNQSYATANSADVTWVADANGTRVPESYYSFTPSTGVLTLTSAGVTALGETPILTVTFEVQTPQYYEIYRAVYAQYYPKLMELAGNDPNNITAEMYELVSEIPPDGVVSFDADYYSGLVGGPSDFFGGHYSVEEPE